MLNLFSAMLLTGSPTLPPQKFDLEVMDSPASEGCAFPNLEAGANGKIYLSWVERGTENLAVMFGSVLEDDGWSKSFEVTSGNDLFLNWADFPSICVSSSGVMLAQWLRKGKDPHGYNAEFALSNDGGANWSAPKALHDDRSACEHGFVSIVALGADSFGAIWLDGRASAGKGHGAGETALYYRTISAKGELGEEQVLDSRVCDCCPTSLVRGESGDLVATYRDRSSSEVRDIAFVEFDGKSWSKSAPVHDDEWKIDGCPVNGPRVAELNGATAIAWFTGVGGGGGSVRAAFRSGDKFGAPLDIDEGRPVGRVDLLLSDKDSALVTWMEYVGDGQGHWRARTLSRTGELGASFKLGEIPTDRSSGHLRMVRSGDDVILTWANPSPTWQIETVRLRSQK